MHLAPLGGLRRHPLADLFSNRAFRLLFGGRAVSLAGDALYAVAATWLVYELTGSTAYAGLASALASAPGALRAFVGPLVDRSRLDRVLVGAELAQALVVVVVPLAAWAGALSVGVVLVTIPLVALAGQAGPPAQNAALPRVVDGDRLARANTAFQVASRGVGSLGRAAGGAAVAAVGAVPLYLADAVTFLVAAAAFRALVVPAAAEAGGAGEPGSDGDGAADDSSGLPSLGAYVAELREGVAVVRESAVGAMVAAVAVTTFAGGASVGVLPGYADALGAPSLPLVGAGDAGTYGLLVAANGAGAFVGSLVATRFEGVPFGRMTAAGFGLSAACWAAGVAVSAPLPTAALFALAYVPAGVYNVLVLTVVQTGVPDGLLGRVTAVVGAVSSVVGPVGTLLGGAAGEAVGAGRVVAAAAVGFVGVAAAWVVVPALRRFPAASEVEPGRFGPGAA
ncbi:MFS transporter [Candidatus Halobonum tyrrellensis]|uniref:Macrolide-efflux protein n=1 Tax=Candidatus Halobonum tyrrellensis G22 TaxID=1324957 RepID=V4HCB5_9EURY|nr:MFS transporter [Candidatus Halobonum tyrrellensis]ESP88310.1 macrolide-efflux protein [Candidatus Halobonum tyrrellensis G22]